MLKPKPEISSDEARRIALAAQGFADARPSGRVDIRSLRRVIGDIGLLQIDSVNVLVRSHYMPLFSRLGVYPMSLLDDAVYKRRELFEAWAHVASLVPVECYPLLRHQMDLPTPQWKHFRTWVTANKEYVDAVLEEVRERGPLTAKDLDDPGKRRGTWWMRFGAWAFNVGLTVVRREFRFFLHEPKEIAATIEAAQFSLVQSAKQGPWEMAAYRRNEA